MLLDPDAHEAYRLYLDKGDLEHDHSPYMLYAEYLDRHGVRNESDVRFGAYLTIMGCLDTDTDPTEFLLGAERCVTSERFAEIALEEIERADRKNWIAEYAKYLGRGPQTEFTRKVIELL